MNRVLMRMALLHCGDVMMNWNDDEMVVAIAAVVVVVVVIPIGMMIQLLHLKQCQIDDESHENATMMIPLPLLLLQMKKQNNAIDESLDDAMMNDASDDDDEDEDDEMILLHLLLPLIAKIAIILLHVDEHEHESIPYLKILLDNDAPIHVLL